MSRARHRKPATTRDKAEATVWLSVFTGLTFLYQAVLDWDGWARLLALPVAMASTFVLMFLAGFVRGFVRDTWPGIHPELAGTVVQLRAGGWAVDGVHRWWECEEKQPHVHMSRDGAGPLVLVWDGIKTLDCHGNVIGHEM